MRFTKSGAYEIITQYGTWTIGADDAFCMQDGYLIIREDKGAGELKCMISAEYVQMIRGISNDGGEQ